MKRGLAYAGLMALTLVVLPAWASAPRDSLRPVARGEVETPQVAQQRPKARPAALGAAIAPARVADGTLRPRQRPPSEQVTSAAVRPSSLPFYYPDTSPHPWPRPKGLEQQALFKKRKLRKGSVCGNIEIQGKKVGDVPGKIRGCGVEDAVAITSVSGVALSRPATMTCDTAVALNQWVRKGVKPTFRRRGPVVEMRVAAHYACRTRNNQRGGRISEHGKGKAIDISAFTMKDGEVITVAEGWQRGSTRRLLQQVHKAACGPFGTVLGPNADRYHKDHFHFDVARYRSGPYCK